MATLYNPNSYVVLGDLYQFRVTGKETNGAFTIIDQLIQPGGGPPPHIHHREDEAFYVNEGIFMFMKDGVETLLHSGGFIHIPKGSLHTFKNIDSKPGKLLVFISPAGLEEFFYKIGTPTNEVEQPPVFDPTVIDNIMLLSKDYHMEVVLG